MIARRYGMWLFDKRIYRALWNPFQRVIIETIFSEVKDTGMTKEFWDVLRSYLDRVGTMFVNTQIKKPIKTIFPDAKGDSRKTIGYVNHKGKKIKIVSNF